MFSGEAKELDLFPVNLGGSIPTSPLQFKIIPIDKKVAATVYRENHYLSEKDFLNMYSFGALHDGEVWGSISFGIPNAKNVRGLYEKDNQQGVLEIVRLAFRPNSPKNSCSRLIRISIAMLRKIYPLRLLITYADTAQNHSGGIYRASGFEYLGLTAKKTDFKELDGKIRKRKGVKYSELEGQWVERSRKHLFFKRFGGAHGLRD